MSTLLETARLSHSRSEPERASPNVAAWICYFGACAILILWTIACLHALPQSKYRVISSYWASGDAANRGQDPYGIYPGTWKVRLAAGDPHVLSDRNLNPPCLLPFFQAAALLPIAQSACALTVASCCAFIVMAALLLWHRPQMQKRQILWLLLSAPVMDTLWLGQIYALLFVLAALAWVSIERESKWSAIWIGMLVAAKPTFFLWPLFLLLARRWKIALRAAVVCATVSALPTLIYGRVIYEQWAAALKGDEHALFPTEVSIFGFFGRIGHPELGMLLACTTAIFLAAWTLKVREESAGAIGICTSILCAPLAWFHYALTLAPAFISRPWNRSASFAAALLFVPSFVPLLRRVLQS